MRSPSLPVPEAHALSQCPGRARSTSRPSSAASWRARTARLGRRKTGSWRASPGSFARSSVKLFAGYIRMAGFAPLHFLSGGSVRDADGNVVPDRTISDTSTRSHVVLVGVNAAF